MSPSRWSEPLVPTLGFIRACFPSVALAGPLAAARLKVSRNEKGRGVRGGL